MDEIASPPSEDSPDAAPTGGAVAKGPVRAYSSAVLSERQPRFVDFLPVRPLYVAALLLLGLTAIAAIEAIHIQAARWKLPAGAGQLAALDVSARGSLAAWYSSLLLMLATASALLTLAIRVHRVDDYRGRYRVWLWATAALGWLSLDAATGLHDALGLAITFAAGQPAATATLAATSTMTWLAIYGLVLGTLGIRLAIEIWPSLASFAALLIAGLLYLCGGLMQLGMLAIGTPLAQTVTESTVALVAHLALTASISLYARHVYLDATGRLKVHIDPDRRRARPKSRAKLKVVKEDKPEASDTPAEKPAQRPAAAAKAPEPNRFGAAGVSGGKPGASISKSSLSAPQYEDDDDDDASDYGGEKLSKSERRRLKKLARQSNQRRAA